MLSNIFQSVFSQSSVSSNPFWFIISLLVGLGLGLVLTYLYRYQTNYSREFSLTLTVLPSLIAVIIFLVNGNLGTSVAVAGAFSLIKFRSPASSSKELLLIFMATAIGLAVGMGYLLLAATITGLIGSSLLLLDKYWKDQKGSHWQELMISLPKQLGNYQEIEHVLKTLGTQPILEKAKVRNEKLELTYHLLTNLSDKTLLEHLITLDANWDISLSKSIKKKKSL